MKTSFDRFQQRRLISSYFSVILIVTLVLTLVGAFFLLAVKTKGITDHFKEQMTVSVFMKDNIHFPEIGRLQKSLLMKPYTNTAKIISKEEAAEMLSKDIGENFVEFLGENPLHNSVDITLKADYVTQEQINSIVKNISGMPQVLEINYDKPLISLLNENAKVISFWILIVASVFGVIAVLLINASIRLSVYSQRFIIKTMQMVGASKGFIRRPFILQNIRLGIIGALLSVVLIGYGAYRLDQYLPELQILDTMILVQVFSSVFIIGVLITGASTFLAAQRFLNLKVDDLYY